jgi:4-amino-4-deoxy-L-arabinose transferase-like glycosyltransferase
MMDLHSLQRRAGPILVAALTGLTLLLRAWDLNAVPPWLWWDEATQGLDARALLAGQFRVFFPSAMGKEPLYIYLTVPFVAAWDGEPAAVRIAGALTGALMIPTLYYAARALWPRRPVLGMWTGVAAAGLWTTNFWPQSINRIGFQVNPFPLILALAVIAWLNYTRRPTRRRALVFGALAGLTLTTYIAARITPLLWVLLYLALPRPQRRALRPTLPWAIVLAGLVIAPLALHFALHPADFFQRMGGVAALQAEAQQFTLDKLWLSTRQLIGGFLGLYGDPIARHNIPNRPAFSSLTGALFAIGGAAALVTALRRRDQAGITLLAWWFVPSIGFLTSLTNAPHFPRLFGALPSALLMAAPVGWLAERSKRRSALLALGGLLALLLAFEGTRMAQDYFGTWARHPDQYRAFQGDTWAFGARVAQTPGAIGVIPLEPGYGAQLDYLFPQAPIYQLPAAETDVANWLAARLNQVVSKERLM